MLTAVFCFCGVLAGCARKTIADLIPEKLGEAEGLYVYYDNYRSLTDGTQRETLLDEIVLDGNIYPEAQFSIQSLKYVTTEKEIFYAVKIPGNEKDTYHLWHYNYDSKESGLIYSFENTITLDVSDDYVVVYEYTQQSREAIRTIVFDMNFNYEPITYGEIKEGELKPIGKNTKFYEIASKAMPGDKNIADTRVRIGEKGSAFQTLYIRDNQVVPTQRAKPDLIDIEHICYVSKETIRNAQTFPTDYEFLPDTYTNIGYICGMSVPPIMIKRIVERLIESEIFKNG
jgi:DNA (cytosine-5)-methyltransferase 1